MRYLYLGDITVGITPRVLPPLALSVVVTRTAQLVPEESYAVMSATASVRPLSWCTEVQTEASL